MTPERRAWSVVSGDEWNAEMTPDSWCPDIGRTTELVACAIRDAQLESYDLAIQAVSLLRLSGTPVVDNIETRQSGRNWAVGTIIKMIEATRDSINEVTEQSIQRAIDDEVAQRTDGASPLTE